MICSQIQDDWVEERWIGSLQLGATDILWGWAEATDIGCYVIWKCSSSANSTLLLRISRLTPIFLVSRTTSKEHRNLFDQKKKKNPSLSRPINTPQSCEYCRFPLLCLLLFFFSGKLFLNLIIILFILLIQTSVFCWEMGRLPGWSRAGVVRRITVIRGAPQEAEQPAIIERRRVWFWGNFQKTD